MDLQTALKEVDEATTGEQCEQLKQAARRLCNGAPSKELEKDKLSLSDIRNYLHNHACNKKNCGLEFLYALAEEIGLPVKELKGLHKFIRPQVLEQCKKCKDFQFEKMIIKLSNEMTANDFKQFFDMCRGHFTGTILFEKFPTIAQFFTKLISARKVVWQEDVSDLYKILEHMEKIDCLKYIDEYRESTGKLGQPEEAATPPSEDRSNPTECDLETAVSETGNGSLDAQSLVALPVPKRSPSEIVTLGENLPSPPRHTQPANIRSAPEEPADRELQTPGQKKFNSQSSIEPNLEVNLICPPHGPPVDVSTDNPIRPSEPPIIKPEKSLKPAHPLSNVGSSLVSQTGDVTDRTRLLPRTHPNLSLKKWILKFRVFPGLFAFLLVIVFLSSLALLVAGPVEQKKYEGVATQTSSHRIVGNDSIILGKYDSGLVTSVTVEEKTQYGDSSHLSNVYWVPVDKLNKRITTYKAHRPTISEDAARIITNLINGVYYGLYMLEMSNISYSFNISCKTTGSGKFYMFSDQERFDDFRRGVPGAEKFAVFHQGLNIGSFNSYEPTRINVPVTKSSYYFLAADLPAGVTYNFFYEINATSLNHLDFDPKCKDLSEDDHQPCSFSVPDRSMFYVLAYAQPQDDFESAITHLQVTTSVSQFASRNTWNTVMLVGVSLLAVFVFIVILLTVVCCVRSCKRSCSRTNSIED